MSKFAPVSLLSPLRALPRMALVGLLSLAGSAHAAKPSAKAAPASDEPEAAFVGVVPRSGATPGLAARVEAALARAFEKGGTRVQVGAPKAGARPRGNPEDLARLLADARGRFFDGDFKGAVTQCDDAIARFESTFAYTDDEQAWRVYADLMVVRVLALQRLDKGDAADRALLALIAQRPDFVPDPGLAPPKVIERHRELKEKLKGQKAGAIVVESTPAGASVLVDGRQVGVTPLQIDDALAGPHYVAVAQGAEHTDTFVVLKGSTKKVEASFRAPENDRALALRDAVQKGGEERDVAKVASAVSDVTLAAVVDARAGKVSILVGRFEKGVLVGVTVLDTADDLKTLDDDAALLADAALWTEGERDVDGKVAAGARARFLGVTPPTTSSTNSTTDAPADESEGPGVGLFVGIGAAALVGVVVVVGAATAGVLAYLFRPPNPGGTDVLVDASRL